MNYVTTDIHNDNSRLNEMLKKIGFEKGKDHLYILGDIFDRAGYNPQPFGVYYTIKSLEDSCTVIRGNHDQWLADYIGKYLDTPEDKRKKMPPYSYNTFLLIKDRMTEMDLKGLSDWIMGMPLQASVTLGGEPYLFAHAETSSPNERLDDEHYLMGEVGFCFLKNGIEGFISLCGHNPTDMVRLWYGDEYRPKKQEVWINAKKNVYMLDCGCGFSNGRLACIRLEDKTIHYV